MKIYQRKASVRNVAINGKRKYTVISTFAGIGGSSLGYKLAGFKELLAIEWDKSMADIFKLNFPGVALLIKDIALVSAKEIFNLCNLKRGELDVLDGSPPCQGFSISGKREVNDKRNDLFKEYVRLIKELNPKVFVMENVSGMIKGNMKGKFIEIIKSLKKLNYNVKCKLMNSMYYEVPQSRERLIFIGVRKDLKINPIFPHPVKQLISVKTALGGVQNKTFYKSQKNYGELYSYLKPGKSITDCVPKKIILKYAPRFINNPKLVTAGFGSRLPLNKPAYTITRTNTMSSTRFVHPNENRILTIEEIKRIASYPDNFEMTGHFRLQWGGIGNSVPPKFMYHIARTVKDKILKKLN